MDELAALPLIAMVAGLVLAVWTWRRERAGTSPLGVRREGELPDTRPALLAALVLWALGQIGLALWSAGADAPAATRVLAVSAVHTVVALAVLRAATSGPAPTLTARASVVAGALGGVAVYGLVALVSIGLVQLYAAAGVEVPQQNVVEMLRAAGPAGKAVMVLCAVLLAPFAEEVFYRGVLLPTLARWISVRAALVAQALLFGFSHFWQLPAAWPLSIAIAVVGWGAGWMYLRTGSLRAAVVLHATFNALQVGLLFATSA